MRSAPAPRRHDGRRRVRLYRRRAPFGSAERFRGLGSTAADAVPILGNDVHKATLGIVGMGRIGVPSRVEIAASDALLYTDARGTRMRARARRALRRARQLRTSRTSFGATPLPETRNLIDARPSEDEVPRCSSKSRGPVVDEPRSPGAARRCHRRRGPSTSSSASDVRRDPFSRERRAPAACRFGSENTRRDAVRRREHPAFSMASRCWIRSVTQAARSQRERDVPQRARISRTDARHPVHGIIGTPRLGRSRAEVRARGIQRRDSTARQGAIDRDDERVRRDKPGRRRRCPPRRRSPRAGAARARSWGLARRHAVLASSVERDNECLVISARRSGRTTRRRGAWRTLYVCARRTPTARSLTC